jgi:C-terminal processing protease CtpA/Prc
VVRLSARRVLAPGTEQQLFSLRGGDGLLLTTVKWASSNGKTFLGEDRAHSGVAPSVEVKGQEVAEVLTLTN